VRKRERLPNLAQGCLPTTPSIAGDHKGYPSLWKPSRPAAWPLWRCWRDLKSLGLYTARSLSTEGIEYELVEHALMPEQKRIYDAYAGAFEVIHNNLTAALEATHVTGSACGGGSRTLSAQAKSAARSAFESTKQRFQEVISDCPSSWLSSLRNDHPQGSCP
jgi:hypothetical protein